MKRIFALALPLVLSTASAQAGGLDFLANLGGIANGYANPGLAYELQQLQQLQALQQLQQQNAPVNFRWTYPSGRSVTCYGTTINVRCY